MIEIRSWRGDYLESRHYCALAVVDADGTIVQEFGDVDTPVYPRSAVKSIQALPLVESGAFDRFGLSASQLALACSSHSGADHHRATARNMLERSGLGEDDLRCGPSWPYTLKISVEFAANGGMPGPIVHCCSGKHAGFLCLAQHLDLPTDDYHRPTHAVQAEVLAALEEVTSHQVIGAPATDGCSIPAHRFPLRSLALGMARMATGNGLQPTRAKAGEKIISACMEHPEMVGGDGRYDTKLMQAGGGEIFAKTGAEGIYCGAIPSLGLGIAVKCQDGSTRAAEIAFGAAVNSLHGQVMENQSERPLKNAAGLAVGRLDVGDGYP